MFLGEYSHSLDGKYRMIVPAKFRDELGSKFVITRGLERCIFIYPMEEWKRISDKLKELPFADEAVRKFQRFFVGGAFECEPDNQKRCPIPQNLRDYAQINKEIVSVGLTNRIELWSKENWTEYMSETTLIDKELAEYISRLGI